MANRLFESRGTLAMAVSCGIFAVDDSDASVNSVAAMRDGWNINISGHKARMVGDDILAGAHNIITMTMGHKNHLCALYPDFADKVHAVKELYSDGRSSDIDDPFGASLDVYIQCARQIEDFLMNFDWEGYL